MLGQSVIIDDNARDQTSSPSRKPSINTQGNSLQVQQESHLRRPSTNGGIVNGLHNDSNVTTPYPHQTNSRRPSGLAGLHPMSYIPENLEHVQSSIRRPSGIIAGYPLTNISENSQLVQPNARRPSSILGVRPSISEKSEATSTLPLIYIGGPIQTVLAPASTAASRRPSYQVASQTPFATHADLVRRKSHFGENHSKFVTNDHLLTEALKENPQMKKKNLAALDELSKHGQTPEMILAVLHSKQSERATTYADQVLRAKRIFESNDAGHTGHIDYQGFHHSINAIFGHLSDEQTRGLFAYFDKDHVGKVSWDDMQERGLMVPNPKSGNMLPKQISHQISQHKPNS